MVVTAITATSISLSWSVVGGSVARSEVVWRETDRGTESYSGSLTGTSYTIDQLESTTIYTVTVRASNAAGTTESQPITFSTGMYSKFVCWFIAIPDYFGTISASDICEAENTATKTSCNCSEMDNTAAIIGGVVAVALIVAVTVIVVVLVLRGRSGSFSTAKTRHVNRTHTLISLPLLGFVQGNN